MSNNEIGESNILMFEFSNEIDKPNILMYE